MFGEIAPAYDTYRPSYPDELYDTVVDFGCLRAGDRAVEIGAGTGKATNGFLSRGIVVDALEPSAEMAAVARAKGIDVEESLFETWTPQRTYDLVYAAQAWHWVEGDDRCERAAAALAPGGTLALFWNKQREWTGALGAENAAAYAEHAPERSKWTGELSWVGAELDACAAFTDTDVRRFTWSRQYTRAEWVGLLGTHSDHLILPAERRSRLHGAVGDAIDRHGGRVDVVYDTTLFLSRRS